VGRHDANQAEVDFLRALMSGEGATKEAAELEPETAEALGVPTVSPTILDQLEQEAESVPDESKPAPGAEPTPVEEPVDEAVDVGDASAVDEIPVEEDSPSPELPSRTTHGRLFTNRRAHPLQIFDVLVMRYKEQWTDWEPETLWWALRRDFGPIGELTRNKIQALALAATTDMPWLDWDVFENCGQAWNDNIPIFGAFQPMTPMQAAFAVQVLRGVRPDEEFGHEVQAYLAAILDEHGWVYAPEEWFDGAQNLLDRKTWMLGFKAEVATAWEQIADVPPEDIEWQQNDARGVHLLKLAVVKSYLDSREELRQQVPGVSRSSVTGSPPVP
jgi:hypothetical protein